jgi:spermidine synthase
LRNRSKFLLCLFFVSGGCGLIYEVVWTRLFLVVIGNTVFSVSAILTVFMAGLALGSLLAGRWIDRRPVPLVRTYAKLEAAIGIFNLLLPVLLIVANPLFGTLYASAYDSFLVLTMARVLIALLILIVPATLMGATLPILIRFYVENISSVGAEAGRVYTANTWGAAVGTAAAGFALIPYLGVNTTLFLTAGLNLLIAALAWSFSRTHDTPVVTEPLEERTAAGPRIILIAMFLSGFAALVDEVAWTRVLGLVVGPTTYAFTLMLTSMIAGIGIGAAIGSRRAKRNVSVTTFAWIEICIGLTSLAVVPLFGRLPVWIGQIVTKYVEEFRTIQAIEFAIFFGLMLVPTTLLGMTFPIASRLYTKSNSLLGTEVSTIYAFNTVGGILGSLTAGFLLVPSIGSQWALILAAGLNAATGILIAPPPLRWAPAAVAALIVPAVFLIPRWDAELMTSGAYKYAPYYNALTDLESTLKVGDLVYYKEGATTTVSARKLHGETSLAVDGKVDATDSGDMTTQKMLGHLPLLLSDNAKNVAIIGLGSGVTAGAALQYPIESLDVIEISPEVVTASDFFKHVNHDALRDKRTQLIIGDGRNHLRYIRKQYDVIISEPSNPWMSGMASLFSREFFQEALQRLTPKGIHCQWFHSYNMSTDDLRTVIATFRSVFPHAQLWALNQNDFLLLGSPSRIEVGGETVSRNFAHVTSDLKPIGIVDLYSVVSLYLLEDNDLDTFSTGAVFNTDSHPVLEFHTPRFIYANTSDENFAALTAVRKTVEPPPFVSQLTSTVTGSNHRYKGEMYLTSDSFKDAIREFRLAIEADANDSDAWAGLLKAARSVPERPDVKKFIEDLLARHPVTTVQTSAAEFYGQESAYDNAISLLQQVLEREPKNVKAWETLVDVQAERAGPDLATVAEKLLALEPENAKALYNFATVRFYEQRLDEAIQLVKRSLAKDSTNPRARNLLAIAYGQTFQHDLADAEFRKTIQDFPNDVLSLNNYGLYLLDRGRTAEAMAQFRSAVDLNPEDVQAFVGLGEAARQSGQPKEADRWYRIALRLDPNQPVAKMHVR